VEIRHGVSLEVWDQTKAEVRGILVGVARSRGAAGLITYKQLVARVLTSPVVHNPRALWEMLDEISISEARNGWGMLSAVVVQDNKRGMPGPGFFTKAAELGRDVSDQRKFWLQETAKVYTEHAR
jgi:hypothetical protein